MTAPKRATLALKDGVLRWEVVNITAEIAKRWLEKNTNNRNVSDARVQTYAADMAAGKWLFHHQGIAFDESGALADGQHRLLAVVRAQEIVKAHVVSVPMLVTYGIHHDACATIDGQRVRTIGDQLKLFDGIENSKKVASRCRAIRLLEEGCSRVGLTVDLARRYYSQHRAGLEWASRTCTGGAVGHSATSGALVYAFATDPNAVDTFARMLREGAGDGWGVGHPAHTLREWLGSRDAALLLSHDIGRRVAMVIVLRCLTAFLRGEKLSVIRPAAMGSDNAMKETIAHYRKAHQRALRLAAVQ